MASEGFHEAAEELTPTRDLHRAILSLMEELEAIDWYIEKVHNSAVIEGAVVLSTRGGDFLVTVGGDFAVGYRWHDQQAIHLFCVETIAAQLLTPEARSSASVPQRPIETEDRDNF